MRGKLTMTNQYASKHHSQSVLLGTKQNLDCDLVVECSRQTIYVEQIHVLFTSLSQSGQWCLILVLCLKHLYLNASPIRFTNVVFEECHTDRIATISNGGYLWWELVLLTKQMAVVCIARL